MYTSHYVISSEVPMIVKLRRSDRNIRCYSVKTSTTSIGLCHRNADHSSGVFRKGYKICIHQIRLTKWKYYRANQ